MAYGEMGLSPSEFWGMCPALFFRLVSARRRAEGRRSEEEWKRSAWCLSAFVGKPWWEILGRPNPVVKPADAVTDRTRQEEWRKLVERHVGARTDTD